MTTDQPRLDPLPLPHGRSVAIACSIRRQLRPHQQQRSEHAADHTHSTLRTTQPRFTVTSTQRVATNPTTDSPRLYRIPEAMRLLSISRSVLYEQLRAGRLRSVTQGRTRLIPAEAITAYIELLTAEADRVR
jgi:excisionase family DNA binding protein